MIVIFLSPIFTPLTSMIVFSFLNSRLTSFQGARIGKTLSTPGNAVNGWLCKIRSSPMTPMMVRSWPVEICDFSPSSRSRSMMWSTSRSEASGFKTIIMVTSRFPYRNARMTFWSALRNS